MSDPMEDDLVIEAITPQPPKERNSAALGLLVILLIAIGLFALLVFGKLGDRTPSVEIAEPIASEAAPTPEPDPIPAILLPRFDIVRVTSQTDALFAGRTEPNSDVQLLANGATIAQTSVGADGSFVFQTELPESDEPLQLSLTNGAGDTTGEIVLVQPPTPDAPQKLVQIKEDGTTTVTEILPEPEAVVETQETPKADQTAPEITALTLDTINYSETGSVLLGGRLTDGQNLRVYVDNEPASLTRSEDGQWSVELTDIDEGIYTLRVDALAEDGSVEERVESPFKRVYPEVLGPDVTIQPGYTLWKLAEIKYGSGDRYLQIVNANRDIIKNPDLIYPGQLFELPGE
ncbi:MAG: hypothetical protein AAF429_10575 [Pseudomonadota bacterium]